MSMHGLTYDTILRVALDGGDVERKIRVSIDYSYFPAYTPRTPPGEYAPIDPPEPASVEIGNVRLRLGNQTIDCPPFIADLIDGDEGLYLALINDAENARDGEFEQREAYLERLATDVGDDQLDERQEWRDFDPDC